MSFERLAALHLYIVEYNVYSTYANIYAHMHTWYGLVLRMYIYMGIKCARVYTRTCHRLCHSLPSPILRAIMHWRLERVRESATLHLARKHVVCKHHFYLPL